MGAPKSFKVGDVVYAPMDDPQGTNTKYRPAMVLGVKGDEILIVAITSKFNPAQLSPTQIGGLPWNPGLPKARSGLSCDSVVDCQWFAVVPKSECNEVGYLPPKLVAAITNGFDDFRKSQRSSSE